MKRYASDRRTAVVFHGSGASAAAYHAGVLRALDDAGVRIDLLIGSGAGVIAAAFGAIAAGPSLYGDDGLWTRVAKKQIVSLRPALRFVRSVLSVSGIAIVLPAFLALVAGVLLPLLLVIDFIRPGFLDGAAQGALGLVPALKTYFLAGFVAPTILIFGLVVSIAIRRFLTRRGHRVGFESAFSATAFTEEVQSQLWAAVRGPDMTTRPSSVADIGKRYAALVDENLSQPGYREVILRVGDLETSEPLRFALLRNRPATQTLDLRSGENHAALHELLCAAAAIVPFIAPRRITIRDAERGSLSVHRVGESSFVGGAGLSEAIAAGAEQILLVATAPDTHDPTPDPRAKHGFGTFAASYVGAIERTALKREWNETERINRMVETLIPQTQREAIPWIDPLNGRQYRSVAVFAIRPGRELDGPVESELYEEGAPPVILESMSRGNTDALSQFVEPHLGADVTEKPMPAHQVTLTL